MYQANVLQRALGFQPEDLEANRAGRLSQRQRAKIETAKLQYLFGGVLFGIILIIFFGLLIRDPFTGWPVFGLCLGTILLVLVVAIWLQISMLNADLAAGSVTSVTGPAERDIRRVRSRRAGATTSTNKSRYYYVQVGEKRFQVMRHVYDAFEEGQVYEVFFLEKSNTIMAADFLESAASGSTPSPERWGI